MTSRSTRTGENVHKHRKGGRKLNDEAQALVPTIYARTEPAELIVIDGDPTLSLIANSDLAWVNNSEADLFLSASDGHFYFLVSGRWFKADTLDGPWTFATPDLPADFLSIPDDHPRADVRALVPGTPEAEEAVMLAQIPQKATVDREGLETEVEVEYAGEPEFSPIDGTAMSYGVNTANDVIKVGDLYYLCFQAVWFVSTGPAGPWEVTDAVPRTDLRHPTELAGVQHDARDGPGVDVDDRDVRIHPGIRGGVFWVGVHDVRDRVALPAVLLLPTTLLSDLLPATLHLWGEGLLQPLHRHIWSRCPRLRTVWRGRLRVCLQPSDGDVCERRRGLRSISVARMGRGVQPSHRHIRPDPTGSNMYSSWGRHARAARQRLGADRSLLGSAGEYQGRADVGGRQRVRRSRERQRVCG